MNPESVKKYKPYPQINLPERKWPSQTIDHAPVWCSVDLRDGNQALVQPMSLEKKLEMFNLLVDIGFKEIEVGFPSASEVEYAFTRKLIEEKRIPDDVVIQVLTQARPHLIEKSFAALKGARQAILHLYNSTSSLQRKAVFKMSKKEIIHLAVQGAQLVKAEAEKYPETNFRYEYSPESFTGTELDFAIEICEAVIDVFEPTTEKPIILNLPATVEMSTPNVYADQIEWFGKNIKNRDAVLLSLHAHNDRGCAVAATELAMMAGGQRVEGTLFGNGERTGNVDIVTLALNMFTQGINPGLNMDNINALIDVYERVTKMQVHPRHPYAGELVYTAFSGSHQDAINKGMHMYSKSEEKVWEVPYLPIDPTDVGRTYESIIRINSQSGKGGVAYIMEQDFGFKMPKKMHPEFGTIIQSITDGEGRELEHKEIGEVFEKEYLDMDVPFGLHAFHVVKRHIDTDDEASFAEVEAEILVDGVKKKISARGNGPLDAFCTALKKDIHQEFSLCSYHEHALNGGSSARAVTYIELEVGENKKYWGAGVHTDIIIASVKAVLSSLNRATQNR